MKHQLFEVDDEVLIIASGKIGVVIDVLSRSYIVKEQDTMRYKILWHRDVKKYGFESNDYEYV